MIVSEPVRYGARSGKERPNVTKRERSKLAVLLSGAVLGWIMVLGLLACFIGAVFGLVFVTVGGVLMLWAGVALLYRFLDEP